MRCKLPILCAAGMMLTVATAAHATDKPERPQPQVFADVLECRAIADADARLKCFDTAVAALEQASTEKSVVVLSEETVQETRRGLFGFTLPKLNLFGGGGGDDENEVEVMNEITSTIDNVRGGDGRWVFTLPDGAVWEQTDGVYLKKPRAGQSITIKRAALGSYKAKVDGGLGFRVKRVN
jgi:hypothetical protein